jgi:hypothetical protein
VREAKPITEHAWRTGVTIASLPVAGLIGWAWLAWLHRGDPERLRRILGPAAIAAASFALLFWQVRAGPASQLLGVVGCAALTATLLPRLWNAKNSLVVVLGSSSTVRTIC